MAENKIPIIFDTDLGEDIDDLYALYMAILHPGFEVLAVTTVHGDTQAKARLAKKVLRMAGYTDIPIGAGIPMSQERIRRGQDHPDPAKAARFLSYVSETDPEWNQTFPQAEDVLHTVLEQAEEFTLVVEGAFSNIAALLREMTVADRRKINCAAVMAGETQHVHNEYNVLCDPEAADYVFNSGIPVFMATYYLAQRLKMNMDDVKQYFGGSRYPAHQVLYDCTQMWFVDQGWKLGPVLYDLVPLFWLLDETCVRTCQACVRVELDGQYTRGQTIRTPFGHGMVQESLDLDADAMVQSFIEIMLQADPKNNATS